MHRNQLNLILLLANLSMLLAGCAVVGVAFPGWIALLMGLWLVLAGCKDAGLWPGGSGTYPPTVAGQGTGAILAHVVWPDGAAGLNSLVTDWGGRHAAPPFVEDMRATVSGADMTDVVVTFDATPGVAGSGIIDGVPVGTNRTLTMEGLDLAGNVIYLGVITGIEAVAGQVNDVGTVSMVREPSMFTHPLELSTLDGTTGFALNGVAIFDRSGSSVASAGDVNGDGFDDVIIGAYGAEPNGSSSGSSYVVFGHF